MNRLEEDLLKLDVGDERIISFIKRKEGKRVAVIPRHVTVVAKGYWKDVKIEGLSLYDYLLEPGDQRILLRLSDPLSPVALDEEWWKPIAVMPLARKAA